MKLSDAVQEPAAEGLEGNTKGEVIRVLRLLKCESMAQFADSTGYSKQSISAWERGALPVRDVVFRRILRDCGATAKSADAIATEYFKSNPRGVDARKLERFIGNRSLEWVYHPVHICVGFDAEGDGDAVVKGGYELEVKTLRGLETEFRYAPSGKITREHLDLLIAALEKHVVGDAPQNMNIPKTETAVPDADLV